MTHSEFITMLKEQLDNVKFDDKPKSSNFYINKRPVSISLDCPYCDYDIEIPWEELDVPEYWDDDWGEINCPCCNQTIKLEDYEN